MRERTEAKAIADGARADVSPGKDSVRIAPGATVAVEGENPHKRPPRPPLKQAFRALHNVNYRLFWSGQIISMIGTWMQRIAQAWLVLNLTHSPA